MKIRAAISPCPNDVFIFSGLITGAILKPHDPEFEFSFFELETLNTQAQLAEWDLVKISYANYPNCSENYSLLKSGGALGRGCGPLLLSNQKNFDPTIPILVPGQYTTANFLLDYFLEHTQKLLCAEKPKKVLLPFDELYQKLLSPQIFQGVVIHEMRFIYQQDGLKLIQDLGEFWEKQTGFPIPLGAVVLKKSLAGISAQIEALIERSITWAYANRQDALALCRQYSQSLTESVLQSHIDLYVNDFSKNVGADGQAAIDFFFSKLRHFFPK